MLTDENATRAKIINSFLDYASDGKLKPDDRVVVFFAGHGLTKTGNRGEIGYLVPVDGSPDNLATLIRWDELTHNADLIPAKHTLFIMDACYGGLAVTRVVAPGSMRFLKDMLQRYTRQVITAGKADETVSDAGGPRPGHSVFTGHLLDALDGSAASNDGIITANNVMAYVYDRVAKDRQSRQTPHYGFLDGDGDFIFNFHAVAETEKDQQEGRDTLITIPAALSQQEEVTQTSDFTDLLKEYRSRDMFSERPLVTTSFAGN